MKKKQVILMVNSECNAKCKHCYLSYKGHREVEDVLELIDKLHIQGYRVIIAGSETLLNLAYLKAYERAGQKYLFTNGILLSQNSEIVDELCQYGIEEVQISLHFGIQKDLQGVSEKIIKKAINNVKKKGLRIKISTVITKNNYRNILDTCKRVYELGANGIKFIRYINSGKAKMNSPCLTLDEQERIKFFEMVDSARNLYLKDKLEILAHGNFGPRHSSKRYCPAGIDLFAIDPNNNVYGCPFLMKYPIGKLIEGRIVIDKDLCSGKRNKCLTDYFY